MEKYSESRSRGPNGRNGKTFAGFAALQETENHEILVSKCKAMQAYSRPCKAIQAFHGKKRFFIFFVIGSDRPAGAEPLRALRLCVRQKTMKFASRQRFACYYSDKR